jgi:hypothetical protein
MHFTCRSFIGKTNNNSWSQYWENEPDDQILVAKKGHLFGLINLNFENVEEDVSTIGHDIIFEINQSYFSEDDSSISECLDTTIRSITNNPLYKDWQMELILAVVLDQHLYIASYKSGYVIISRNDQISLILENQDCDIKKVDGPLAPEDKIFLTTANFFDQFSFDKIKTLLSTDKVQTIEENTLAILYSIEDQSGLAAALVQIHFDQPETIADSVGSNQEVTEVPVSVENLSPKPGLYQKLFSFLKNKTEKPVYVFHRGTKQTNIRKKIHLVVIFFLVIGLSISSYFGYKKNKEIRAEKQYQSYKTQLDEKINNIAAVKNINLGTAQKLAEDSRTIIEKMLNLQIHKQELDYYQSQIQQILSQTGSSENFSPEMLIDLVSTFKDSDHNKILVKNEKIYLLDPAIGRINEVNISEKNGKSFSSDNQIKEAEWLSDNNGSLFISDNSKLYLVNKNSVDAKIDFTKFTDLSISDISFWNGAVYILDSTNSKIWKINSTASGFGTQQSWIKNDKKISSTTTSFTIDGNIWILDANGQITSYTSGVKQEFNQLQSENISKANHLSTSATSSILAFSSEGKYVFVYKKTGELQAKYNLDKIEIIDLAVDDDNSVFVLSKDQKIYKINN